MASFPKSSLFQFDEGKVMKNKQQVKLAIKEIKKEENTTVVFNLPINKYMTFKADDTLLTPITQESLSVVLKVPDGTNKIKVYDEIGVLIIVHKMEK